MNHEDTKRDEIYSLEVDRLKEAQRIIQELTAAYNHKWAQGLNLLAKKK